MTRDGTYLRRGLHGEADQGEGGHDAEPGDDPPEEPAGEEWQDAHPEPQWSDEDWREWRRQQKYYEESSSGEDLPWDELEIEDMQVLPDEVLGWLLLRRANLSSASRLAVQASVQNSLMFQDIENALRDQEEELLQGDQHRHPGRKRTYWVEEEGAWGLLMTDGADLQEELAPDIHWVGSQLPSEVYAPGDEGDDEEIFWSMENDGWHGYVMDNSGYWLETDGYGAFWAAEEETWDLSPEQQKEVDEAYAIYENKVRGFQQSRQLQKAKGVSRGFYPVGMMMKGKGKGKRYSKKGKGKPTSSPSSSTSKPMFSAQATSSRGDVMTTSSDSGGCFICGERGHGWRQCPKRSSQSTGNFQGKGAKKGTYWIESLTPSLLSTVFMVTENEIIYDTAGYGVLDIGATETVTSLESLEKLLHLRRERGNDDPGALRVVANGRKPFRFGNGEVQTSESFILLRQHLGKRSIYLGMYTLNVEKVPILVGVKTLTKLGAIIDVKGQCMVLTSVDENTKIPLKKSSSGHLLVDLTQNWLNDGQPLMFHETSPSASSVYMVQAADSSAHSQVSEQFDQVSSQLSIHELAGMLHHDHEFREDPDVMMVNEGEGEGDMTQEASLEILEEAMVLTSEHHDLRPLAQVTQDQRDRVMRSLITSTNRPSSIFDSHGAEEGEGGGAQGGALRLLSDGAHEQGGSPMHGSPVPRGTRGGPTRAGLQDGGPTNSPCGKHVFTVEYA